MIMSFEKQVLSGGRGPALFWEGCYCVVIFFYERENGECPVEDFLSQLNIKMRAKMVGLLEILEEKGNELREPYSKHLTDGIYEIRCKVGSDISRALYFFYYGGKIILTNGFIKKTQKTSRKEIKLAQERRKAFLKKEGGQ